MSVVQTEILLECNDALDVSLVSDFRELLKQAAGQNLPVVLDASALDRVDAAALQLITAFFIEAKSSGLSVAWREPSAPLCRAAAMAGLKEIMAL